LDTSKTVLSMTKTSTIQALNPTLSLLILKGMYAKQGDLLRITFFDLLHRDILYIKEKSSLSEKAVDARILQYVGLTDIGRRYSPAPHEAPFFNLFVSNHSLLFLFQQVVKAARKKAGTISQYRAKIALLPEAKPLIDQGFWQKIFGGFSLTAAGERARAQLAQALDEVAPALKHDTPDAPHLTSQILAAIGVHALLIDTLDFEQLGMADSLYAKSQQNFERDASGGSGCSGDVGYWYSMSGTFDDGGDGHDGGGGCGGGDGGCGGGCSGCGGGCGGCGS
jgi:hypothetical protein